MMAPTMHMPLDNSCTPVAFKYLAVYARVKPSVQNSAEWLIRESKSRAYGDGKQYFVQCE